jgi:hypothetical protein
MAHTVEALHCVDLAVVLPSKHHAKSARATATSPITGEPGRPAARLRPSLSVLSMDCDHDASSPRALGTVNADGRGRKSCV